MPSNSVNSFCGESTPWNESLLLDNSWPQFTKCFQETVLTFFPCGFLWLASIVHLVYIKKHMQYIEFPTSCVYLAKVLCSFCMAFVAVIYLLVPLDKEARGEYVPPSFYLSRCVWIISFIYTAVLQRLSQRSGIHSPCIVFIFWVFSLVCHIVPAYSVIMLKSYKPSLISVGIIYITLSLIMIQLILQCMGSNNYVFLQAASDVRPCPSVGASFPSKLVYSWVFRIVYTGYKKTVELSDLSDLPPYMQCKNIVPKFIKMWTTEAMKYRLWKTRKEYPISNKTSSDKKRNGFALMEDATEKTSLLGAHNHKNKTYGADISFKTPKRQASLYKVLLKIFYLSLFKAQMVGLISDMLSFSSPLLLEQMIDYTENRGDYPQWRGFVIAGGLFIVVFVTSMMNNFRFYTSFNIGTQVKTSLIAAVYKKSLTLNADSGRKFTIGTTVNLMAVDCPRFLDLTTSMWAIISCPLQLIVGFYLLYNQLGIAFIAGIGVLLFLIPANGKITTCAKNAQAAQISLKDQRVKLMNEVLNGIRVLKLYAWETSFQKSIAAIRKREVYQLKKAAFFQALNIICWLLSPLLLLLFTLMFKMMLSSFIAFVAVSPDNTLTPTKAFVSMSIFNMIKQPMNSLPNLISSIIQCHVSMRRLRDYLSGDDLEGLDSSKASDEYPVVMKNGTFSWDETLPPVLTNVTVQIPRGKLVAVVGQVGAGKSSFLSALLGEMNRNEGYASIKGSIGYVPQQAWIQNITLRENILFGKAMNTRFYKKVIKTCALDPDIQLLPGGELTEIGEKGINLSGGQKQRINLARAVYQEGDVFLLDDPLSAVDAHVGKHIFDNVLGSKGLLHNKTRVLVTHGIHWLPMVDSIVVIDQGRVTESGSYEELMSHDGPFAQFVKTYLLEHLDEEIDSPEVQKLKDQVIEQVEAVLSEDDLPLLRRSLSALTESSRSLKSEGSLSIPSDKHTSFRNKREMTEIEQLIQEERTETGNVKSEVFMALVRAFGYSFAGGVLVSLVLYNSFNIGGSIWLAEWTSDPFLQNVSHRSDDSYSSKTLYYLGVYSGFSIVQGTAAFLLLLMVQFVNASQHLHNRMLDNILHQNMAFFDTTPMGRVLNRFSRDVDVTDANFTRPIRVCFQYLFVVISVVVVICYTSPIFLAVFAPVFTIYVFFQKFYIPSSRQFRRLESITRSPIFSHFAQTINGASTIRAYRITDKVFEHILTLVDTNNRCFYANSSSGRWLRIRLEVLGNIVVASSALFAVLLTNISASLVGLSITYALQITFALNFLVQNATQLETNSVSVERIVEYSSLPREPSWIVFDKRPPPNWPQHGRVEFCGYSTRYRPGLDLVLKAISFTVSPGEKIGIVGRTGAGKSSLSMSLFRVMEAAEGKILIDGIDISTLGLHDLRSNLTILPQDPVLFSGSLRFNLDPFNNYPDNALWQALDNAHMGDFVRDGARGLDFECEEGGQNLSVGQRQLVCLARSLLRKTKILVLDEATAAVDLETDYLLQQTIREAFRECTVLTVAHRLKTVIDYDRILVLSEGEIVEFDTPTALMENENSIFHGMAKESNLL